MNNNFTSRLNMLDDQHVVISKKLCIHDKDMVIIKQDVASHKLLKERQYNDLSMKQWELAEFKNEFKRQMEGMLEHTYNTHENCNDQVSLIQKQFEEVREPLFNQIGNLIYQN